MKEILEELQKIWPAGAVFLVLILAYVGVRKIASPKNWGGIRILLWNSLKLSLDISATRITTPNTTPNTVLLTLGYFRKNAQNHHSDHNSLLLDLYEKCMKYYCCFWWNDRSLFFFLMLILISIPLFKVDPILPAVCAVAYFGITLLAGDKAKEIEKMVTENAKESRDAQISYLNNKGTDYCELS